MKMAFLLYLWLASFVVRGQSTIIADSTIFAVNHSFLERHHIDLHGYDYRSKEVNTNVNEALHYRDLRNSKYMKAAIAGGLSAIAFTVLAIHTHHQEQLDPQPYESYAWIPDLFVGVTGGVLAGSSAFYMISGVTKDIKMHKALRQANTFLY